MAFGESGSIISSIAKFGRRLTQRRRRQEFPTKLKVVPEVSVPRRRLQDMYNAADVLLTFMTPEKVKVATSAQPGACASTSGMWHVTARGACVASDWIDVGIQPRDRGMMKRLPDGRVGIFVGVDAAGRDVLCHTPQRFHAECAKFDGQRRNT